MKKLLFIGILICNVSLHAKTNELHENVDNPDKLEKILSDYAQKNMHGQIFKLMLERNATEYGDTPFHLAIRYRQEQSCIILSRYLPRYLIETITNKKRQKNFFAQKISNKKAQTYPKIKGLTLKQLALDIDFQEILYLFEEPLPETFPARTTSPSTIHEEATSAEGSEPIYEEVHSPKKVQSPGLFRAGWNKLRNINSSSTQQGPPLPPRPIRAQSAPVLNIPSKNMMTTQKRSHSEPHNPQEYFHPLQTEGIYESLSSSKASLQKSNRKATSPLKDLEPLEPHIYADPTMFEFWAEEEREGAEEAERNFIETFTLKPQEQYGFEDSESDNEDDNE